MARRDLRSSAPELPVRTKEQLRAAFPNSEQGAEPLSASERIAAELLDAAFNLSGLTSKEAGHLCGVSPSLVDKWRSSTQRGSPSFVQMLMLPISFQWQLHKSLNRHFGFGTTALRELLDAVGLVAGTK
jgi:hypothetical protein